jgi:hypothetical protein
LTNIAKAIEELAENYRVRAQHQPEPPARWADVEADLRRILDDDRLDLACAWSDFRKEYGVDAADSIRKKEHRAFKAGWDAGRDTLDIGGAQR